MNKFDLGIAGLGSTGKEHLRFYLKKKILRIYTFMILKKLK